MNLIKTFNLIALAFLIIGFPFYGNTQEIKMTNNNTTSPISYDYEILNLTSNVPTATFSHLWWFGDNGFSFDANPNWTFYQWGPIYGQKVVTAIPTENYGSNGPPPMSDNSANPSTGTTNTQTVLSSGNFIYLQNYRSAVINDTMYLIITYAKPNGTGSAPVNGKIILTHGSDVNVLGSFQTNNSSFLPNGEQISTTSNDTWSFTNLKDGEERSILVPIRINSSASENVNIQAEITIDSIGELQTGVGISYYPISAPVALSHDPNKMNEYSNGCGMCGTNERKIDYMVEFQNTGEGPTQYVRVKCQFDDKLDLNSIENIQLPYQYGNLQASEVTRLNGSYVNRNEALYVIDETAKTITFEFQNLVLAPLNPPNSLPRCVNLNATKSSVSFSIRVKSNYRFGDPTEAYSEIYFDTNDPIMTGTVSTGCCDPVPMNDGGGFSVVEPVVSASTTVRTVLKYGLFVLGGLILAFIIFKFIKKKN